MSNLAERYADQIAGRLDCLDRMVITGTLPEFCFEGGMAGWLKRHEIPIGQYAHWAAGLSQQIRDNAQRLAGEQGLSIEYLRGKDVRKEERVKAVLKKRGDQPGLVHVFSVMEGCGAYRVRGGSLVGDSGKCVNYYFYFMDADLGLCYVRVPTWCPFKLQFYCNGHGALYRRLGAARQGYRAVDNALVATDDWGLAQSLANAWDVRWLHGRLDQYARRCCPVLEQVGQQYHWSLMQVEYSSDLVFTKAGDLQAIYGEITRAAIQAVKVEQVAKFLGKQMTGQAGKDLESRYDTQVKGTRIRHRMGTRAAVKMYDKCRRVLRIETTVNDVTFFKHYREVEQRDGTRVMKVAALKKSIYSLPLLIHVMREANARYLGFISDLDDSSGGLRAVTKISRPAQDKGRNVRGLNLFDPQDLRLVLAVTRGEFAISGMTNKALRPALEGKSPSWVSRQLKRLRLHGLIKRIGKTYKYYLTKLGRTTLVAALKLREQLLIPTLAKKLAVM